MGRTFLRAIVQVCVVLFFFLLLNPASAICQITNPFFTPPTYPGTGQELAADVNGDGKPDLLFWDGTILLGNGDGTFTKSAVSWNPFANQGFQQFAIADFNGDGKPDLLTASPSTSLSVYLGNGDGTFQQIMTGVSTPVTAFVVGDLNGDGKPDVLAEQNLAFFTFINNGDGTFSPGIPSGATDAMPPYQLADFNHDGKLDLLLGRGLGIQLGNGDGTFQAVTQLPSGILTGSSVIGDFDGDGNLDIAVTGGTSSSLQLQILFGKGDGTFRAGDVQTLPPNIGLSDFVAADLNGDGKPELVGSTGSTVQVFANNGSGIFSLDRSYNASNGLAATPPTNMVVADFNHDGKNDVAAYNTMLLGNGDDTLQGNDAVGGTFRFNAMGDFNGDGHQDFASIGPILPSTANPAIFQADLTIWLNDGKNNFTQAHTYAITVPSPNTSDIVGYVAIGYAADLNGDGKIDLAGYIWDASGLSMIALLGNGDGSFGSPISSRVNSTPDHFISSLAYSLADVNGDHKPDVLITAGTTPDNLGTLTVLLGNGDGTFAAPNTALVGALGNAIAGDFNGDKKPDLVTGSANGLGILFGNGDGTFQPITLIPNGSCATACANPVSADFNSDGQLDLMVVVVGGYQVLLGKGDGTFNANPAVTPSPGVFSGYLQVADLNGDGKPDVLGSIGQSTPSLGLILGNGDGTFGSPFPVANAGFPFIADFNGDNKLDILEVGNSQIVLVYNNGQGTVTPPPPPPTPPDFSLGSGSGSATVTAGSTATYPLSLAGTGGFSGTVTLKCSVAPAGPTCSVSPSSVTVSGSAASTATVSVTTTARSGILPMRSPNEPHSSPNALWIFGALLAAAGVIRFFAGTQVGPRRLSWSFATASAAMLLLTASLMSGCGGGSGSSGSGPTPPTGTPSGNYTVTVTGTSGTLSHTKQLALTVQ
jgi:hypothetical protein